MNLNTTLEQFLNSQVFDEDNGTFIVDLPINVRSYINEKANEYCDIERMLSTDDIVEKWGSVEQFQIWKNGVIQQANEVNFQYLCGMIHGLVSFFNQYQRSNGKDVDDLERIDIREYVKSVLNYKFNTDME